MAQWDDQAWVRLLKQNDEAALVALWELLFNSCSWMRYKYSLDEQLAQAAAAKAYDKLIPKGVAQFKFNGTFKAFVLTILARVMCTEITRRVDDPIEDTEHDEKPLKPKTQDVFGKNIDPENLDEQDPDLDPDKLLAVLAPCLEALPERERKILETFFLKGFSLQQIADELGITRTYATVLNSRARNHVKLCLQRRGILALEDLLPLCNFGE